MEKTAGRFFEIPKRKEKSGELLEDWSLLPLVSYLTQVYIHTCNSVIKQLLKGYYM